MNEKRFIVPPADIFENENEYVVVLDMPGADKNTIDVQADGDALTVNASTPEIGSEWKPLSREFTLGDYRRRFQIGSRVNVESIDARYDNGILTLKLAKAESAKPRRIEVKSA